MSAANRNPPSLALGVGVALVLALCGAAVLAALGPLAGWTTAWRAAVALLGLAYVLYILGTSGERVGRVTTVALWLAVSGAAWLTGVPLAGYVLIHVGLVWLVRSLYSYSGVLPAAADLGLCALGLAFAAWAASRTDSAALAFWCFFLAQAFHALLPASMAAREKRAPSDDDSRFCRAERTAEAALRQLSANR